MKSCQLPQLSLIHHDIITQLQGVISTKTLDFRTPLNYLTQEQGKFNFS